MIGDKGGNCWQRLPIKARHCQPARSSYSFAFTFFPPSVSSPSSFSATILLSSLVFFFNPSLYFSFLFLFLFFSFLCRLSFLTSSIHLSFYRGLSLPFNLHLPLLPSTILPSFYQATRRPPFRDTTGEIFILRGAIARSSESLINDSVFIIKPSRSTIYFWITFYPRTVMHRIIRLLFK